MENGNFKIQYRYVGFMATDWEDLEENLYMTEGDYEFRIIPITCDKRAPFWVGPVANLLKCTRPRHLGDETHAVEIKGEVINWW